jgi:hypothetical protein
MIEHVSVPSGGNRPAPSGLAALSAGARSPLIFAVDERWVVGGGSRGVHATVWWIDPHDPTFASRDEQRCSSLVDPRVDLAGAIEDALRNATTAMRLARALDGLDEDAAQTCCDFGDNPTCYRNHGGSTLPY